jgi:hypothetical protein
MSADTSSYLASARTTSIAMIIAVLFVGQLGIGIFNRMAMLSRARQGLAAAVFGERVGPSRCVTPAELAAINTTERVPGFGTLYAAHRQSGLWEVTASQDDGRRWSIVTRAQMQECPRETIVLLAVGDATELTTIAETLRLSSSGNHGALYRRVEFELVDSEVDTPGIGVRVTRAQATWTIAFVTVLFMTLIRHYVRQAVRDPKGALDEPWILLDGHAGLELLVARCWTTLIAIAPWIANGVLLVTITLEYLVYVPTTSVATDVVVAFAVVFLLGVGAWVSLTLVGDLLRLRDARLASWLASAQGADEESSDTLGAPA